MESAMVQGELRRLSVEYLTLIHRRIHLGEHNDARWREVRGRLGHLVEGVDGGPAWATRGELRVPSDVPIRWDAGTGFVEGRAVNLTTEGVFVVTAAPPAPGAWLAFELEGDPALERIAGRARVVWTRPGGGRRRPGMGIRFGALGLEERAALESHVAHALASL